MNTTTAGNEAEQAVASYLTRQKYKIIGLNWKNRFAEIDVIAEKDKIIYFIEVKYRKTLAAGDGFDYITASKLHHMNRAAEGWVLENTWDGPYELLAAAVTGFAPDYQIDLREV